MESRGSRSGPGCPLREHHTHETTQRRRPIRGRPHEDKERPIVADIWNGFKDIILQVLVFFYRGVGDYGVAIVLLTVVMRIILTPIMWKQTKSMLELQRVQPKIKALQEKYKNNKEKQQEELMKFYQENKVNPFGGCLPLLAQMPIFIALYGVLGGLATDTGPTFAKYLMSLTPAAREAARHFWIILPDLTMMPQQVWTAGMAAGGTWGAILQVLPYAIFVILFGVSVWLPQYLMTTDPTQRKTGTYMAIFMLYIGWVSPAGVLLYWVTSSAWQVGQQLLTQRIMARSEGA
jgi:YidC/Oxa1 family membrane protein insertase